MARSGWEPADPDTPGRHRADSAASPPLRRVSSDGRLTLVGESYYQHGLRLAAAGPTAAVLVPEPDNPVDRHAVRVDLLTSGHAVTAGYLSRSDAAQYQPALLSLLSAGFRGICPAQITGGRPGQSYGVVLHIGPPSSVLLEGASDGLTLLEPARNVVVTKEERHQAVLACFEPGAGSARRVAVELAPTTASTGRHSGEPAIAVRLNGHSIGELTHAMSQRYGDLVDEVINAGRRPGCEALIRRDERGIQAELRLPEVEEDPRIPPPPVPATPPRRSPRPSVPPPREPPEARRAGFAAPSDPPRTRQPRRKSFWIVAGGAGAILLIAGLAANGRTASTPTSAQSTVTSAASAAPAPLPSPDVAAAEAPTAGHTASAQVPAPRQTPTPAQAPPASKCDPNYSGCVPIATDVDCQGGSGNGPAYVRGPVWVIGTDIYGLDANNNGVGCE